MHPRRLYAHRGASAERPENTLLAFERALEHGVDALELDVHITRDGVVIVAHDDHGSRMTGSRVRWAETDLADIQRLDAGWGFLAPDGTRPFAGHGITIPTFEDVLTRFPGVQLNVDIKGNPPAPIVEVIRTHGAEEHVTLAGFETTNMVKLRRMGYGGETALSQGEVVSLLALPALAWRQLPFTGTAVQVPTHQGAIRLDRQTFIAKCHSLGLRVDYWVIDDPGEAQRLLDLGADGIMTNDPAVIAPLFSSR